MKRQYIWATGGAVTHSSVGMNRLVGLKSIDGATVFPWLLMTTASMALTAGLLQILVELKHFLMAVTTRHFLSVRQLIE